MKTVTTLTHGATVQLRNWYIERGMSEKTGKAYESDLRGLLLWANKESISLEDFPAWAAKYLNETRGEKAPKTTERRLTAFRAFGQFAGMGKILEDYKPPTPARSIPRPLPGGMADIDRLAEVANTPQHKAIIGLCGRNALRIEETITIRPCDFNVKENLLTVRGKGDKTRIVPLAPGAFDLCLPLLVEGIRSPKTPLIMLSESAARKAVRSMGKRAGIDDVHSHRLRATLATHLLNSGVNVRVVQMILGHASVVTTEVYTLVSMNNMREALTQV